MPQSTPTLFLTAAIFSCLALSACHSREVAPQHAETATLTDAPQAPPPITRNYPARVVVNLETSEVTGRLADGVQYRFWTFGGHVPGKFIRVREGDTVEIHLHNADTAMAHNIDLHAVTGPGGGGVSSETAPGHTSVFSFKALQPGLFVYHCATSPMGVHIANGMYGMILVEPKQGLPHVDHEYYVMQSEFYTKGAYGDPGLQPFDMQKALDERPPYVVFNGSVGALMGDHALKANVGETIRLFVGNIGPNLISSFHVVGSVLQATHIEDGKLVRESLQTTLIPAGSAEIVEFTIKEPGSYAIVDHSMFRANNKGAMGTILASGAEDKSIYSWKIRDEFDPHTVPVAAGPNTGTTIDPPHPLLTREGRINAGGAVFQSICINCHQANGQGLTGIFPPLAKSDFLNADKARAIGIVMNGRSGKIKVNGQTIMGAMPVLNLKDDQIANVLTYVYNSWGNSGKDVTSEDVAKVRAKEHIQGSTTKLGTR